MTASQRLLCIVLFLPALCFAQGDEAYYFDLRFALDESRYFDDIDTLFPAFAARLGFSWGQFSVEYDYSKAHYDEGLDKVLFQSPWGQQEKDELKITAHNAFVNLNMGDLVFAKFKLGHSYQRVASSETRHILKEVNTPAAGLELGIGRSGTFAIQYLWLGDDNRQTSFVFGTKF